MLVVDSHVYIDLILAGKDVRFLLQPWILSGDLLGCGVIRAEVLRGILSQKIRNDLSDLFDVIPEIPTNPRLWREVADLAWRMDRKGKVIPLTDVIIAACSMWVGATVISEDRHFAMVPGLKTQSRL